MELCPEYSFMSNINRDNGYMILAHLISQLVLYFVQMKADSGIN
jgi:hypothetical protein